MTVAAVTMVWNDAYFLRKWLGYYGPLLGGRNLYVVAHGDNPYIRDMPGDFNVIQVPRDPVDPYFDRRRWALLSHITSGLTRYHDAVICTDVDEIIVPTAPGVALSDVLSRLDTEAPCAVPGFELFPGNGAKAGDATLHLGTIAGPAVFSPFYSKTVIARKDISFYPGGHGVMHEDFELKSELMLLHLKYLDLAELDRRNAVREDMAEAGTAQVETEAAGWVPFKVWNNLDASTQQAFQQADAAPELNWPALMQKAVSDLARLRVQRGDVFRFKPRKYSPARAQLPDWAQALF